MDGLKINRISIPCKNKIILSDSFIPLEPGKVIGITGANGSGKTTLLRYLAGVRGYYAEGLDISIEWLPENLKSKLLSNVAYLAQTPRDNLITRYVEDEIFFSLQAEGLTIKQSQGRIDKVVGVLGLESLRTKKNTDLSEGEAQKVALAEALSRKVSLALLDEPTAYLDSDNKKAFFTALRAFITMNPNCRVIVASHDQEVLDACSNKIYTIEDTQLIETQSCSPDKLVTLDKWSCSANRGNETPAIIADRVSYSHDHHNVLEEISILAKEGALTALIGKNGVGKTTLLKILAGLIQKNVKGSVKYFNQDIKLLDDIWPDAVYMLFQQPKDSILEQTVRDELELNSIFWGGCVQSSVEKSEELMGILHDWGISPDDKTATLSTGQKKVLSMVPAICRESEVVIWDEPFSAVDKELRMRISDIISDSINHGKTFIVSDHDEELWVSGGAYVIHPWRTT
ncbi:MAG: ATP-binding cassette domain-containing protein [Sedimenticola sp.]